MNFSSRHLRHLLLGLALGLHADGGEGRGDLGHGGREGPGGLKEAISKDHLAFRHLSALTRWHIVPGSNVEGTLLGHQHGVLTEASRNLGDLGGKITGRGTGYGSRGPLKAAKLLHQVLQPGGIGGVGEAGGDLAGF
jgi:hypothetical protein